MEYVSGMCVACLQPPSTTGDAHSLQSTQSLLFSSITTENGANSSIPLYPTPSEQSEHSVSTRFSGSSTPAVRASSTSLAVSITCSSNDRMKHSIPRSPCGDLGRPVQCNFSRATTRIRSTGLGELFTNQQADRLPSPTRLVVEVHAFVGRIFEYPLNTLDSPQQAFVVILVIVR